MRLIFSREGFPQFASFFSLGFPRELQNASVCLPVAICAKQITFSNFTSNCFPRSCVSLIANTKTLESIIFVVKIQCLAAFAIATNLALATQQFNCHFSDSSPTFSNCENICLGAIGVFSFFGHICIIPNKDRTVLQPFALPLSYSGIYFQRTVQILSFYLEKINVSRANAAVYLKQKYGIILS